MNTIIKLSCFFMIFFSSCKEELRKLPPDLEVKRTEINNLNDLINEKLKNSPSSFEDYDFILTNTKEILRLAEINQTERKKIGLALSDSEFSEFIDSHNLIITQCNEKINELSETSSYSESSSSSYDNNANKNNEDENSTENSNNYSSDLACSFESDNDVLAFLIGKTFRQKGGSISIRFSTDGAIISGSEQYQWISYQSLGGHKGYVKLASINPSHPDGTIKLWVSCRDNAVTDGETVLLYD